MLGCKAKDKTSEARWECGAGGLFCRPCGVALNQSAAWAVSGAFLFSVGFQEVDKNIIATKKISDI